MRDLTLETLAAKQSIVELRYEYAYRLDDRDWEGWVSLFTEDVRCEFAGRGARNRPRGVA